MSEKVVIFDSSDKSFIEKYGNQFRFEDSYLLDDNPKLFAQDLRISIDELKDAGFKISAKKLIIPKDKVVRLRTMQGEYGLPECELGGIIFNLIGNYDDPYQQIKVIPLEESKAS